MDTRLVLSNVVDALDLRLAVYLPLEDVVRGLAFLKPF